MSNKVITKWSELPEFLDAYRALLKERESDGIGRVFGYASLVNSHGDIKPTTSSDIPNERARLYGRVVGMNVLAAGEFEFRGTRGIYENEQGEPREYQNVGVYAGLEPATEADGENGYAEGMLITVGSEDIEDMLYGYIKRELGEFPGDSDLRTLLRNPKKFKSLEGTDADNFGMYKLEIVTVNRAAGKPVPALTVSTNQDSPFAFIGKSPMQVAHLILDGQGWVRELNGRKGGSALDYFNKAVMDVTRQLGFHQPRLEAIAEAVGQYADMINAWCNAVAEQNMVLANIIVGENLGIATPYSPDRKNVNERPPVSEAEKQWPENKGMAHTAEEKHQRILRLREEGKTHIHPAPA